MPRFTSRSWSKNGVFTITDSQGAICDLRVHTVKEAEDLTFCLNNPCYGMASTLEMFKLSKSLVDNIENSLCPSVPAIISVDPAKGHESSFIVHASGHKTEEKACKVYFEEAPNPPQNPAGHLSCSSKKFGLPRRTFLTFDRKVKVTFLEIDGSALDGPVPITISVAKRGGLLSKVATVDAFPGFPVTAGPFDLDAEKGDVIKISTPNKTESNGPLVATLYWSSFGGTAHLNFMKSSKRHNRANHHRTLPGGKSIKGQPSPTNTFHTRGEA